jgi:hypothetical protein
MVSFSANSEKATERHSKTYLGSHWKGVKMKLGWMIAGATVVTGVFVSRLVRRPGAKIEPATQVGSKSQMNLDRKVVIPTAMATASIALWMKMSHGNTLKYTFVPSMAAAWAMYMVTYRKRMPDPKRVTAFYLLALAWQLVHFVEENSTGFRYRWPVEIFGAKPYGDRQYVAINALSYAIFIAGGVALMKKRPEFSLPAIFFAIMGVMYNGVQHPIYSYMVKSYFPGLFTGIVDLVIGPLLLRRMFDMSERSSSMAEVPVAA